MNIWHWLVLATCFSRAAGRNWRRRPRSSCATNPRLQDKWHFIDQSRRVYVRIRSHQVVYRHGAKQIKFKCIENKGNIYLLKKRNYRKKQDAILCLGFSYIADHPRAEYSVLRLMGPGEGSNLLSPIIKPKNSKISIAKTCQLDGNYEPSPINYITNSFIRRAQHGCRFPKLIQGRWNYTYKDAKSFEIWMKNATLHLMNGTSIKFHCDKKDGGVYVFRARQFVDSRTDAIMCAEFTSMPDDLFYSFKMSRHNSGPILDDRLRPVSKSKPVYIQLDCDWIGSPARPEYLYP